MRAGKSQNQAVAIAYSVQRQPNDHSAKPKKDLASRKLAQRAKKS